MYHAVLPAFEKLVPNDVEFSSVTFTPDNIAKVMRKLKNSTSCGPDRLPPVMFRNLTGSLAGPLSVLFNNSMSVGKLPTEWKKAIVTPMVLRCDLVSHFLTEIWDGRWWH